ncbi:MAG: Nif3-like dinuclear metal center hexameric protein [Planctomycetes bacterium]|nr:Nif3-like dinuclear metal center hexameric protein [Planctomycetota bacterium]
MKISDIVKVFEDIAPTAHAMEWDNVGLLVGDSRSEVRRLMLCVDMTRDVLAEAVAADVQLVMAYHPVIFRDIRRITESDSPVVYGAARAGVSVYSMHTALDVAPGGTNDVLADAMGLEMRSPLVPICSMPPAAPSPDRRSPYPGRGKCKIVAFVPPDDLSRVADAAFSSGAGHIGKYERCAFFSHGIGTFLGKKGAQPTAGQSGRQEATEEMRLEIIAPISKAPNVVQSIRSAHSYEEPAIDVYPLQVYPEGFGMGRIGSLPKPMPLKSIIAKIKKAAGISKVMLAETRKSGAKKGGRMVQVAACAAGSCGPLYRDAVEAGATFYLTGEMKHHDALAATAAGLTVVCLGHSNSERLALVKLAKRIKGELPRLPVMLAKTDADPFDIA